MHVPYQCLLICSATEEPSKKILVAAQGSFISTFDILTGNLLCTWPHTKQFANTVQGNTETPRGEDLKNGRQSEDTNSPPAAKRQKTSSSAPASDSSSAEIVVEDEAKEMNSLSNAVILLAVTSDGKYLIAATSEDKCIRVLELSTKGELEQYSERIMPKRPCALRLTPESSQILCADKFGDVYSLPLLGRAYEVVKTDSINADPSAVKDEVAKPRPFVPSATSLTVHTKRNLDSLKQQQNTKFISPKKASLAFEHQLLLGHVSLLTDLGYVSIPYPGAKPRQYIITSDRDEHIRVSRGIPQTHVTVGYCFGHTQFVSCMRFFGASNHLLLSGGGDDFLILWDWLAFKIKEKIDLRVPVDAWRKSFAKTTNIHAEKVMDRDGIRSADSVYIAVSHIQTVERGNRGIEIIVTCEGIPALFFYHIDKQGTSRYRGHQQTDGNVLDLAALPESDTLIFSMDTVHIPFSTSIMRNDGQPLRPSVQSLHFSPEMDSWEAEEGKMAKLWTTMEECAYSRPFIARANAAKGKSLRELLYGLESLRKRSRGAEIDLDDDE